MKCKYHLCDNEVQQITNRTRWFCSNKCKNKYGVDRLRYKRKFRCIAYKGDKCSLCGYCKCKAALTFHHREPSQKSFNISNCYNTKSWNVLKNELDKCDLLCRNCHAEVENLELEAIKFKLHIKTKIIKKCVDCSKEIASRRTKCGKCHDLTKNKIVWPSTSELLKMISESNYCQVAKKLGVSDNAIRKRLKSHPV